MTTPATPRPTGLSVQLYTVREDLAADLPGTLQRLADLGLTQVEPFGLTRIADDLGPALQASGLSAPTTHQHVVDDDEAAQDALFATAARLGIGTVIDPMVAVDRWSSAAGVEDVAARLNAAAAVAARHGVAVGYHNHAHELTARVGGTSALEHLAAHLDDAVGLELDTYWAAVGGEDPVALLGRLGDRVVALHVKDGPISQDNTEQVAVGSGAMPVREVIAAAPAALRVIELDDSAGDRFTAVADSVAWLRAQGLA